MTTYLVTWEIDIDADWPYEAAVEAAMYQRDHAADVHVFDVRAHGSETAVRIDLDESGTRRVCHYKGRGTEGWYCQDHQPAGVRIDDFEVRVFTEGVNAHRLREPPCCAACGRVHDWVGRS